MVILTNILKSKIQNIMIEKAPDVFALAITSIPFKTKQKIIEQFFKWQFQQALNDGKLNFLAHRWLKFDVTDLRLTWYISVIDNQLQISRLECPDVTFTAKAHDLILIACRLQTPEALFLENKIRIEGDTKLALQFKNVMEAVKYESMPKFLQAVLIKSRNFITRFSTNK